VERAVAGRRRSGRTRPPGGYRLLFHDTHHRAAPAPDDDGPLRPVQYDGVLAFGEVIRELYLERGWAERRWTWHEAADARVFTAATTSSARATWCGSATGATASAPPSCTSTCSTPCTGSGCRRSCTASATPRREGRAPDAGIRYGGWIANHLAPQAFAAHGVTVHVPRRPYVEALPGIPTIRPFEALACGIPLVSAPWDDAEHLFTPGTDYLVAADGRQMESHLRDVLHDPALARFAARERPRDHRRAAHLRAPRRRAARRGRRAGPRHDTGHQTQGSTA
jgi:hypothetical protein